MLSFLLKYYCGAGGEVLEDQCYIEAYRPISMQIVIIASIACILTVGFLLAWKNSPLVRRFLRKAETFEDGKKV